MNRDKQIIKVSLYGILTNIALVIFKSIVWFLANSIAIVLDAVNNLSDVISSLVTIIWIKLSSKKPDKEHPYWHGRIEYFASIVIAIIILIAWFAAAKESIQKIITPVKTHYTIITIIVVTVAIFVKYFLWTYYKKQWKKLNSWSLTASGADAMNDCLIALSTLVAALISIFFHVWIEWYIWIIISFFIIKTWIEILKDTVNEMIWTRADSDLTNRLKAKVQSYEWVLGVYDMMLHNYGPNKIIGTGVYDMMLHNYGPNKIIGTAHIQVNDDMTAKEIHRLTRNIQVWIYSEFGIIITIWIYASNNDWEFGKIQKELNQIIRNYENIIQMHGFYVDDSTNNISFDLIFDFKEEHPEKIVKKIKKEIKTKFPDYEYSVIIDNDVSE